MNALLAFTLLAAQVADPTATAPTTPTTTTTTPATASADDLQRARDLYVAGGAAYAAGQYPVAIDAFEEVLRIAPRPQAWFSLAQAYRLQFFVDDDLHKLERAVVAYRRYLADDPTGPRRDHAAEHLSVLVPVLERRQLEAADTSAPRAAPARLIVSSSTDNAVASVDGGPARSIPATFEVAAGVHTVVLEAPLHQRQSKSTVAIEGAVVAVDVTLVPVPARLNLVAADGAVVRIDGTVVTHRAVSLPPGVHVVGATAHGRVPVRETITLQPDETRTLTIEQPLTTTTIAGWTALGVGVVGVAAAAVPLAIALGVEAEGRRLEALNDERALRVDEAAAYRELPAQRDFWSRTATITAVVGAAVVVGAGAALLLDSGDDGDEG